MKVTTTDALERVHIDKESGGDGVVDQAGNLLAGVLTDDAYWDNADLPPTTGVNWAVATDGANDLVQLGNQQAFTTTTGELSAALWFKPDTIGNPYLLQAGNTYNGGYTLQYAKNYSTQQWEIILSIGNGNGQTATVTAVVGSALAGWHHVAFSFEHGGTTTIYLDGTAIKTQYTWVEGNIEPQGTVTLGNYLNGKLADFRLYHRALTASEISTIKGDTAPLTGTIQIVEHIYDVNDRWIGKKVDKSGDGDIDLTERYVYDGDQIVLRFADAYGGEAESWDLKNVYLWGQAVDQLFAQEDFDWNASADDVKWALTDNLGTVRDLVEYDDVADETNIVNHLTYAAFGKVTSQTNLADPQSAPVESTFQFTGRIFESCTGLQNNWYRWYDHITGKWMSQDPIEADKSNNDRYVNNNPTNSTDPKGLEEVSVYGEQITFSRLKDSILGARRTGHEDKVFHLSDVNFIALELGYRANMLEATIAQLKTQINSDEKFLERRVAGGHNVGHQKARARKRLPVNRAALPEFEQALVDLKATFTAFGLDQIQVSEIGIPSSPDVRKPVQGVGLEGAQSAAAMMLSRTSYGGAQHTALGPDLLIPARLGQVGVKAAGGALLRGLGRAAVSQTIKATTALSKTQLRAALANVSMKTVRDTIGPRIREHLITLWRSELGSVDTWALMTLGIKSNMKPLSKHFKDLLRDEARAILGPRFGIKTGATEAWKALGYSVHHLIPLRFAHLFKQNPNRPGLIAAMENAMHRQADDAWDAWAKALGREPTAAEVLEQAKIFHRQFGEHMWIAPGKQNTFP